ncbi:3-beta-hydroxysteroid dehydrogenase [Durotheca rogersii]|uniref:3-beta-hydroxysteroid dehydrogenase n=1 Tax=Durotheca rogersii TaxID=419775 RepID=UPI0022200564|nr:3-beta-hydroxysteroid dehydrogenase [Durotheca rogersii]KAI5868189.1 3-beta-hydroxysteroid dehydrogenase [Durotheca rogersii]
MSSPRVAIVTGGASGLGLAVAETLCRRDWRVHIFDINEAGGSAAAARLTRCVFHEVDVTAWHSLSSAFDAVFAAESQLDFVFANAGVMERGNFFERRDFSSPPPEPDELSIDANLKGVVKTSYLAQHYFRANTHDDRDCVLVMTSSIAGIYPQAITPLYAASKAGILNFMRSVAPIFHEQDKIRTYAICPGSVRTNLLAKELWDAYPQQYLTSMEKVLSIVESLAEGARFEDSKGKRFDKSVVGLAIEIFVDGVYFREPPDPCNEDMSNMASPIHPGSVMVA